MFDGLGGVINGTAQYSIRYKKGVGWQQFYLMYICVECILARLQGQVWSQPDMQELIFANSLVGVGFIAMVALYVGRMSPRSGSASKVGYLIMSGWSAHFPSMQVHNCISMYWG
jgi:hypothetical protein